MHINSEWIKDNAEYEETTQILKNYQIEILENGKHKSKTRWKTLPIHWTSYRRQNFRAWRQGWWMINDKRKRTHEQNSQELWDTLKRPNSGIFGVAKSGKIQTNDIENLFSEVTKFPKSCQWYETQALEAFRIPEEPWSECNLPMSILYLKIQWVQNKERI